MKKHSLILIFSALFTSTILNAQTQKADTTSIKKSSKEESNRNVMLNASADEGPRQISIGLPVVNAGDVIILENDLPVVYHYWPHFPTTHWRGDGSLSRLGLLKLSEVQTTTGRVGYATNSYTKLGTDKFEGRINYRLNNYGMQQVDMTVSGAMSKNWLYSGSIYQNFDPGTFKLKYTDFYDRTQIYKGSVTKRFDNKQGEVSLLYKHANSRSLSSAANTAPFIYNGDGSITQLPGFRLGTDCYSPIDGKMKYMDIKTGEIKEQSLQDAATNVSDEIGLLGNYKFDGGMNLKWSAKYSYSDAAIVYEPGLSIKKVSAADGYTYSDNGQAYSGYVQNRLSMIDFGKVKDYMMMAELSKQIKHHGLRLGMNEWYNSTDYVGNSTKYQHELAPNPRKLDYNGSTYSAYNASGEYFEGTENRAAIYLTDDWNITKKLNAYIGARVEYFSLNGNNLPYKRYSNFYLGSTNPTTKEIAQEKNFNHDWILPALTANLTYKMTRNFGLLAEASYSQQGSKLSDYAGFAAPYTDAVTVPYGRAGVYYNDAKISIVSAVTFIKKTNFQSRFNLVDPANANITNLYHLKYDVQTIGWTTDAVLKPFKDAELHLLATIQSPEYKNYAFTAYGKEYNFNNKQVTGISKVLLEIDPSYKPAKNLRTWASFRYFSKQYASISNVLFFNDRWETFAGVDFTVNKSLTLSGQVVNFLNQKGASGSVSGSELMTDPSIYKNYMMSGSYLRPMTFEMKASFKF
jgi:hypothetical protein